MHGRNTRHGSVSQLFARGDVRQARDARTAVDDHESTTGHDVRWEIESLDAGVSQAGADAGVCGRPGCANEDSPLVDPEPPEPES